MLTINRADMALQGALSTAVDARDGTGQATAAVGEISVLVTSRIEDVEEAWRVLSAGAIESPGQSFDFIRLWVKDRRIAPVDQRYVVGRLDGEPVALLPLHRRRVNGVVLFTWFPGPHVGCYAPVADYDRLAALGAEGRTALWAAMTGELTGADLIYLRAMPTVAGGHERLFDELGKTLDVETLYRAEFASWADADRLRSKSRRKHDRQQGEKLDAMGDVSFAEIRNGGDAKCAIETMFVQRSARFKVMGVRDTFVRDRLIGFYHDAIKPNSGVDVRLHVLRLNGAIVAVRYNIVHNDRMFCLISSMSDDPAIQHGSPGKQCLLRVMQSVFDQGIRVFDMGSGFTDEKRHWCNVQIPLQQHYIGLTPRGAVIVAAHKGFQKTRARIKANKQLKAAARGLRQLIDRITAPFSPKAAPPQASD